MISIIVCSVQDPHWDVHTQNVAKTIGRPCEYIRIDNRDNSRSLCAAYNKGVEKSKGDILVFVHEDVFFMENGWGGVLERKFAADPLVGLVGVAGTQYLFSDKMSWTGAGRPFIKGRVVHELKKENKFMLTAFSLEKEDSYVVAVDGLFFAIKRELFPGIRFDEETFDAFHFYDLDISMQVGQTHKLLVTWDILVKHLSGGNPDEKWREAGRRFLSKYNSRLPASCASSVPDPNVVPIRGVNIDLRGKMPQ